MCHTRPSSVSPPPSYTASWPAAISQSLSRWDLNRQPNRASQMPPPTFFFKLIVEARWSLETFSSTRRCFDQSQIFMSASSPPEMRNFPLSPNNEKQLCDIFYLCIRRLNQTGWLIAQRWGSKGLTRWLQQQYGLPSDSQVASSLVDLGRRRKPFPLVLSGILLLEPGRSFLIYLAPNLIRCQSPQQPHHPLLQRRSSPTRWLPLLLILQLSGQMVDWNTGRDQRTPCGCLD